MAVRGTVYLAAASVNSILQLNIGRPSNWELLDIIKCLFQAYEYELWQNVNFCRLVAIISEMVQAQH